MNTSDIAILIGIVTVSILGHVMPRFTRPDLYFGVTVDPAFRNTGAALRILWNYRIALWCTAIAAIAVASLPNRPVVALILYSLGIIVAQVAAHRRTLAHAASRATTIEVDLSAPQEQVPGGVGILLLPILVLLSEGCWAALHRGQVPTRLIVLLGQHALECLFLGGSIWGILHWARRISTSGPAAVAERQFRRRTMLLLLTVEYMTIGPPTLSLLQAPPLAMPLWSLALMVIVLGFVVSLMGAGQGGTRLQQQGVLRGGSRPLSEGGPLIGDRTADARWIGGVLYFNPQDSALLVEKRIGIGWTLNFGNPSSWAALVAVAVIALIGPLVLRGVADSGGAGRAASASPGTEDSLRRYILSLEQGHPNYEEMSPQLASSVRQQLPKLTALVGGLGELQLLTYEGTDRDGYDIYLATFARGQLQWHIGPLVDGKVSYRYVRQF